MTRTCQQVFNLSHADTPGFKQKCRTIIEQMISVYYVDLHAWTIMDNHFHLCISVKNPEMDDCDVQQRYERLQSYNVRSKKWHEEMLERCHERFTDLSWFMWDLNRRIAIAYNKEHETVGHFWGGRFKSKIIEDEPSILKVMAYIEQNPVKAGIVEKPSDFQACSTADNLALAKAGKPPLIKPIGWFRTVPSEHFPNIYRSFMDWLTYVRFGKEAPSIPSELKPYRHNLSEVGAWTDSFNKGEPADWAKQGYGSEAFVSEIDALEQAARLGQN